MKSRTLLVPVAQVSVIAIIVLSLFLFIQCKPQADNEKQVAASVKKITICHSPQLDTLVLIALDQGFLKSNNIDLVMKKHSTGGRSFKSMLSGNCDIAVTGVTPIAFNSFSSTDFSIITMLGISESSAKIVARKDRNILNPSDLKGKTIAVQKGTVFHFFLHMFLSKHGLSTNDVNIVYEKPEEMPLETIWSSYDAIVTKEPFSSKSIDFLAANATVFFDPGLLYNPHGVVARKGFILSDPEAVKGFLEALLAAEKYAKENTGQFADTIISTHGQDRTKWNDFLSNYEISVSINQTVLTTLEDIARWAIYDGFSSGKKEMPDFVELFYLEGLESIKPEAVTIIK